MKLLEQLNKLSKVVELAHDEVHTYIAYPYYHISQHHKNVSGQERPGPLPFFLIP